MDSTIVKKLVEGQLARGETFINFHGITPDNVRSFLVEPFSVRADPDDLGTTPRDVWVVLQECHPATEGFVIVYNPHTGNWAVGEHVRGGEYILSNSSRSLAEAIGNM
jgi:hypothetical protein